MFKLLLLLLPLQSFAMELKFLDFVRWDAVVDFRGSKVGGLSGLSPLPQGGYVAISDDRGGLGASRAYHLDIQFPADKQKLTVAVKELIKLRDVDGGTFLEGTLDPESIVAMPDGSLLISSEGDMRQDPRIAPSVFSTSANGNWRWNLPMPQKFLPESTGLQDTGVRNNQALESLTLAPDQVNLFAIAESALVQDGSEPSFGDGAYARMIHWTKAADAGFSLQGEYAYPLSAVPQLIAGDDVAGINGVSEALALNAESILVIERAFVFNSTRGQNSIRLFQAERSTGEDIALNDSLRDRSVVPMSKQLIFDFDEILPLLPEAYRRIDNVEAMAWGPVLPNGNRTLIFVSDSNFSPRQETQFFLFEVEE